MPSRWSKEAVAKRILSMHRSGEKLNSGHIQVHNHSLYSAAFQYWRGWRQAVEGAGLRYEDVQLPKHLKNPPRVWSREKIIAVIQARKRSGQPLNSNYIQTKEKRLYGAALKWFGGWRQAVTAAGFEYDLQLKRKLRRWTKESIVAEIIRRADQQLSIRGPDVQIQDRGLYSAARRHFGKSGWAQARVIAGFDPVDPDPRVIWTRKTVVEEIKRLHENGIPLNVGTLQKSEYDYIRGAARKVFGSWGKAIRVAGLNYSRIRKNRMQGWWTKPRIILRIRSLECHGVRLSSKAIQFSHGALFAIAVLRFGSWSQAVEAAGISYRKHCRVWSTKAWLRRMTEDEYQAKVT